MTRISPLLTVAASLLALLPNSVAAQSPASGADTPTMQSIAFMTGCWQESAQGGLREHFTPAAENRMTGLSQFWRGNTIVDWEFHRLDLGPEGPILIPHPKGVESVPFAATGVEENRVVFSNPEHDFPNRIIYHRVHADTLVATVEGDAEGTPVLEFRMAKVPCEQR